MVPTYQVIAHAPHWWEWQQSGLTKTDRVSFRTGSRNIIRIRFCREAVEDENEHHYTSSRTAGDYPPGDPLRNPALESYANCRSDHWAAFAGASGTGAN